MSQSSTININTLIDRVKSSIGLNGILKGIYNDNVIYDIIINKALPTFNQYHGFHITISLDQVIKHQDRWKSQRILRRGGGWDLAITLPDWLMRELRDHRTRVKDVFMRPIPIENNWIIRPSLADSMGDIYMNEMMRSNRTQPRIMFKAPNTIIFQDWGRGATQFFSNYQLYLVCDHPETLATITPGILIYFEELCELMIMNNIFHNDLALVEGYNVGGGEISINLDNFKNAPSDLKELKKTLLTKKAYDNMNIVITA